MKPAASILFISLFLFNLIGYRILYCYEEWKSDQKTAAILETQSYDESSLITIEIPLSNPYQLNQLNFERVDGEMTVDGIVYKYVKRKISDGKLILMCLPDHNKTPLKNAKEEFFRKTNGIGRENGSKDSNNSKSEIVKLITAEYDHQSSMDEPISFSLITPVFFAKGSPPLLSTPICSPEHPPELSFTYTTV